MSSHTHPADSPPPANHTATSNTTDSLAAAPASTSRTSPPATPEPGPADAPAHPHFPPNTSPLTVSFLTPFLAASPTTRLELLTSLTTHLRPSEWHHLHTLLTTRSYYLNIPQLLPPELTLQILSYLTARDLSTLRLVSRSYNTLATTDSLYHTLTKHELPHLLPTHPASWRRLYENTVSLHTRMLRFSARGLRTYPLPPYSPTLRPRLGPGGNLLLLHATGFSLLHLPTRRYRYQNQPLLSREAPYHGLIALTASHVFLGSQLGVVSVFPVADAGEPYSFRLPGVPATSARADAAVLLLVYPERVLVHDAAVRETREVLGRECWAARDRWVDAARGEVVLSVPTEGMARVRVERWGLHGGKRAETLVGEYAMSVIGFYVRVHGAPRRGWRGLGTAANGRVLVLVWWDGERVRTQGVMLPVGPTPAMAREVWCWEGGVWVWVNWRGGMVCFRGECRVDGMVEAERVEGGLEEVCEVVGMEAGRGWVVQKGRVWEWRGAWDEREEEREGAADGEVVGTGGDAEFWVQRMRAEERSWNELDYEGGWAALEEVLGGMGLYTGPSDL